MVFFLDHRKAAEPSMSSNASTTTPNNIPGEDTLDGLNPADDKYIVVNKFDQNFFHFVAYSFEHVTKLCSRFSPRPLLHPS